MTSLVDEPARSGKGWSSGHQRGKVATIMSNCSNKERRHCLYCKKVDIDYRVESCHWYLKMQQKEDIKKGQL